MTVEELIDQLRRAVQQGRINADDSVYIRDTAVSEGAMEAGSSGYTELAEVLIVEGGPRLLIEEGW